MKWQASHFDRDEEVAAMTTRFAGVAASLLI